jgi:hypothetical protein
VPVPGMAESQLGPLDVQDPELVRPILHRICASATSSARLEEPSVRGG